MIVERTAERVAGFGSDNGRFQAKIGCRKYKAFTIGKVRRFSQLLQKRREGSGFCKS